MNKHVPASRRMAHNELGYRYCRLFDASHNHLTRVLYSPSEVPYGS